MRSYTSLFRRLWPGYEKCYESFWVTGDVGQANSRANFFVYPISFHKDLNNSGRANSWSRAVSKQEIMRWTT